ncbi:RHS repeat-associated core domain-containing protein, partial [Escherichia coli]
CDRKKIRFTYLWDGDNIAEIREYRDDKLYSVRHLVFNGFELISQQCSRVRQPHPSVTPQWVTRTNYAVSDLTGRPLMLFNSEGKTVWRPGQTSLWGLALSLPADTGYPDPRGELDPEADPGLLYAGQWQDTESGLCYNRFRYYEPETGMYLVSDPLGLLGGEQTYRYVPNPCGYVDPLGLAITSIINKTVEFSRGPQTYVSDLGHVTGSTARARNKAITAILKEDFAYLKLTYIPQYNPFMRTGIAKLWEGTQFGKNSFSSRAALRDVIIHEELHHRWWKRGLNDHHPKGTEMEQKFYETIRRYKRMRGWL